MSRDNNYYLDEIRLLTCLNVACITVMVYDYLLTLTDEIQYVWRSKWNSGKILFFLIRYSVFLDILFVKTSNLSALSAEFCQILVYTEESLFILGIGMVAIMLALRTWIIYNRRKRMGYALAFLLVLLWTIMVVVVGLNVSTKTEFYEYPPSVRNMGCLIIKRTARPDFIFVDVAIGTFEIIILALTCVRVYRSSWLRRLIPGVTGLVIPSQNADEPSSQAGSPVVGVLYRDALLNYVLVLILANLALLSVTPIRTDILAPGALGWQRVAHAILGSRTLLHMRKANQVRFDGSRHTITTINFHIDLDINTIDPGENISRPDHLRLISPIEEDQDTESWFAPISLKEAEEPIPISLLDIPPRSVNSDSDVPSNDSDGWPKYDQATSEGERIEDV